MTDPQISSSAAAALDPVTPMAPEEGGLEEGIGLCLSGGGYRAMLFHAGALWRLNELGYLKQLSRVSSVSGGSITAGLLGYRWKQLDFKPDGNFRELIVRPLQELSEHTVDVSSILKGVLGFGTVADQVAEAYRVHLFGDATLQALPASGEGPRFVINATNVQSLVLCRFSRPYLWDYRVGRIRDPEIPLAVAVAASSAFPPVLSPLRLKLDPSSFEPGSGTDLEDEAFRSELFLTDGGVYDNLGLETVWKRYKTVLVSDGGGAYEPQAEPDGDWIRHSLRVFDIVDSQVRSLRKRQVIGSFEMGSRKGTYWGIRTDIANYGLPNALDCPHAKTLRIAAVPTRLKDLERETKRHLINWGYAVCDAAMRRHVDPSLPAPAGFPLSSGVG